jgi:3-methyladenine DNA glycosylase AlkD
MISAKKLFDAVHDSYAKQANHNNAQKQRAYMKSSMPFWGITKPNSDRIAQDIFKNNVPKNNHEYRNVIEYFIIHACHREEWYAGLRYACMFKTFITTDNLDLYIWINRTCQWWDIVDTVSVHLIGKCLFKNTNLSVHLHQWIVDKNMWIRRTALLTQLNYKTNTDNALLDNIIQKAMHEKDFFIRKAIGWALRQYSKTNPLFVARCIDQHRNSLSALSRKEGGKYLHSMNQ